MKRGKGSKLVAVVVTLTILGIFVFTGPAQAHILGLTILDNEVEKGQTINFMASVEIEQNEVLDITPFILKLHGPVNTDCEFLPNGTIISGCLGISIQQIQTTNYTYGYGFEQGILSYNVTLNTTLYFAGTYKTYLVMVVGADIFEKQGKDIKITTLVEELYGCSLRAEKGNLIAENKDFGNNNDLSFYVPLKNAMNGEGSLIGQKDRTRFSYKFEIIEILENNDNYAVIQVSGNYKIGTGKGKSENAIIFFDKINDKVRLVGSRVNLEDSVVSSSQKC